MCRITCFRPSVTVHQPCFWPLFLAVRRDSGRALCLLRQALAPHGPVCYMKGIMASDHDHAHKHDHSACIEGALHAANSVCEARGTRLTPLRQQVLEALWGTHQAQGAYDVLHALNKKARKKLAPLSVYRALDFLVAEGLAHRIESLNAYVGCPHPEQSHALQFLICNDCRLVVELDESRINRTLSTSAEAHGFTPSRTVVEVIGRCSNCAH